MDKAQEMEAILGEFLLDLTTINGPSAPVIPEIPKIPLLDTRAGLMILLISLVLFSRMVRLTNREKPMDSARQMNSGRR